MSLVSIYDGKNVDSKKIYWCSGTCKCKCDLTGGKKKGIFSDAIKLGFREVIILNYPSVP